jgi:hypothetical protein
VATKKPATVERTLGRIEATLDGMKETLDAHTAQDAANFEALAAKLDAIDVPGTVRRIAWRWAAGIGGAIVAAAQVARALGLLPG